MSRNKYAVALKEATGLAYSVALRIAHGELAYWPRSPDCLVRDVVGGLPLARVPTKADPPCSCAPCSGVRK